MTKPLFIYRVDYTTFKMDGNEAVPLFHSKAFFKEIDAFSFARKTSKKEVSAFAMSKVERREVIDNISELDYNYVPIEFNDGCEVIEENYL
jgi:hypothetical protein